MIICHCAVVNHRDIEATVDAGARTVSEVGDMCGAGISCRGCVTAIADVVARHLDVPVESVCDVSVGVGTAA